MNDGGLQYWQQHGQYQQEIEMGRFAKASSGTFPQAPIGNHVARCIRIYDLGTQQEEYKGKIMHKEKILIQWELPNELMDDGQPFAVGKFYTNSLSEKSNLLPDLENWRGKAFTNEELGGFDLTAVAGKPCMISVVHNENGKARVGGIAAIPKGMQCPPAKNKVFCYWIEEHEQTVYEQIPDGIKKIIEKSPEWAERKGDPLVSSGIADMEQDVPF